MATHSSSLAWRIPWTEEPCGLQSSGLHEWNITEQLSLPTCLFNPHSQLSFGFQGWSICRGERKHRRMDTEGYLYLDNFLILLFFQVEKIFQSQGVSEFWYKFGFTLSGVPGIWKCKKVLP